MSNGNAEGRYKRNLPFTLLEIADTVGKDKSMASIKSDNNTGCGVAFRELAISGHERRESCASADLS